MNGEAAEKLLERMRSSKSGWSQTDFGHLFEGFGFKYREGKHRVYFHPRFPDLIMGVPRHNVLKKWVARDAVKLIDELKNRLELEGEGNESH
jgi:hypothetical protein